MRRPLGNLAFPAGFSWVQDALPPDPPPYGPATWTPIQWLAVVVYGLVFLVFVVLLVRFGAPREEAPGGPTPPAG